MDINRVNEAGKAIQKALESYTYGWPNIQARQEIERLADEALKFSDNDHYVSEKVTSLKSFAAILYSTRKFEKWGGAEKVRDMIYADAYRLTTWE
jgi:CRISPR/Cas system CMR-associated protein Cmr1 (group 7 of RAMP superfamily)